MCLKMNAFKVFSNISRDSFEPNASVRAAMDSPSSVSKNSGISLRVSAIFLLDKLKEEKAEVPLESIFLYGGFPAVYSTADTL